MIDDLKKLAKSWRDDGKRAARNAAFAHDGRAHNLAQYEEGKEVALTSCADDLDKLIAQAKPAAVTDEQIYALDHIARTLTPADGWRVKALKEIIAALSPLTDPPVPMNNLLCPECGTLHVDQGEWETRSHKTHLCSNCDTLWRPFDYPTVGVCVITAKDGPALSEPSR